MNNQRIKAINRKYRGIDKPTDVLAFPMYENNPSSLPFPKGGLGGIIGITDKKAGVRPILLGDIVISMEKTYSQATEHGHSPAREFLILLIHGILHLIGYDHERSHKEEQKMKRKEKFILSKI